MKEIIKNWWKNGGYTIKEDIKNWWKAVGRYDVTAHTYKKKTKQK